MIEAEKRASENVKISNQSPLKKAIVVRFNFTVPVSKRSANNKMVDPVSPKLTLHKLLTVLGLQEKADPPIEVPSKQQTPPEPPTISAPSSRPKMVNSFVQTDPVQCQICEIRKARKFTVGETQTEEKKTSDISTQVSVDDLTKSCTTFMPRGIIKQNTSSLKSISHMTPAQLLAQLEKEKKDLQNKPWAKEDIFPAYGRSYADQPPAVPSTSNDQFRNGPSYAPENAMGGDVYNRPFMYGNNPPPAGKFLPDRFSGNTGNLPLPNLPFNIPVQVPASMPGPVPGPMPGLNVGLMGSFVNDPQRGASMNNMNNFFHPPCPAKNNFFNPSDTGPANWNPGRGGNIHRFGNLPNKFF